MQFVAMPLGCWRGLLCASPERHHLNGITETPHLKRHHLNGIT
jgi:hypothetical protein